MIKLVVLGSSAAVPSIERSLSAVGIRYDGNVYLFDCGEGTQRQMMRFGLSYAKVKCVFVTHAHADHIVGLAGLAQTLDLIQRKEPLPVFCPRGSAPTLKALLSIGKYGYEIKIAEVSEGVVYEGPDFKVSCFPVKHSRAAVGYVFQQAERRNFVKKRCDELGIRGTMFRELEEKGEIMVKGRKIRIEDVTTTRPGVKIVYTGDCVPGESTVAAARGADVLIHDATYAKELEKLAIEYLHSTASQAAELARRAGVKKLVLTHISNRYESAELLEKEAREIFAESIVATDGLELLLK